MRSLIKLIFVNFVSFLFFSTSISFSQDQGVREILENIQKDLRTLERAVYSQSFSENSGANTTQRASTKESEQALTKHLLKLSEIETQFQELTNKFGEINFKLDKLSNKLSKVQQDNQLRFEQIEQSSIVNTNNKSLTSLTNTEQTFVNEKINQKKILPGSSEPQSLGEISYKDMTTSNDTQVIESVEQTEAIISEVFNAEEKLLPDTSPKEQYQFARNFLKVGDYASAEKAFREFVLINPDNELSGNAQYWYAETYRIRQMYTDAATAYLEGYQKYPKSKIAPENLLKLGVSLVQMGEKDQGCLMIAGVKKQYPDATQSVLQKAKYYEEKEFECKKENS
ncbi:tol-pal system protein [Pelagibacteraceae bacterium GOM-A3]|nr:tol-pal system protein [Pelagibacteraceae bacterium GOM-A3]